MRRLGIVLLPLIVLLTAGNSKAQGPVNIQINVPQYNQIYVADLDIEHVKTSGVLFSATLHSTAQTQIQVKLFMSINITLVGEAPFQIAQATTVPITLQPGQVRVITNVDLSGDNPAIPLENHDFDETEFDRIKNIALATGKAPAGIYEFDVKCLDANNSTVSNTGVGQIVVTNPSRVDLVLPMNEEPVTTLFPHFQWSANADTVILSVYEKLPNQQSPQDVVSGVPFLQQTVAGSSFNYPPSGAGIRPLDNGKTYYWYVSIPPSATRGTGIQSDIWSFTTGASDTGNAASFYLDDAATKALENLLTGTQYQGVLSQISTLNGTASYDGSPLSIQNLIDILQNLDKSKITNVTVQ